YNTAKADSIYASEKRANITLYAVWIKTSTSVDLVFDANGGLIDGQTRIKVTLASGSDITFPTPIYDGYVHAGWLDEDKTTPFTKTKVDFKSNKIIYATWSEGTYNVAFVGKNSDGGSAMTNINKRYLEEFNLPANTYQRLGYTFIGWDTSAEGKNVVYKPEAKVSKLGKNGETITLYTVWEENNYTINYFEKAVAIASSSLMYTGSVRLRPNNVPVGEKDKGYIYTYYIGGASSKKKFTSGQKVTIDDFEVDYNTKAFDLYGQLEKKEYKIEFSANKGTWPDGTKDVKKATISYGDKIIWPATPSYGPRKFNGYKVDGKLFTGDIYNFDEDKSFIADWEKATYKVVFNENVPVSPSGVENKVSGTMATQSFIEGETKKLTKNVYSITGYTFVGWATASYIPEQVEAMRDSNSPLIIKDNVDTLLDPDFAATYNYYAMWARNKYNITLIANEKDKYVPTIKDPYVDPNTDTLEVDILYDQKLSDLSAFADKTRSNYTFTGLFTKKKIAEPMDRKYYSGREYTDYWTKDAVYRETKDMTLYPLWKNSEYTVTLNIREEQGSKMPDGYTNRTFIAFYDAPYYTKGTASEPKYANGTIVAPMATPHEARMLDYWSTDAAGTNKITGTDLYLDTSVNTLYANYKDRGKFTVTFYRGQYGNGSMPDQTFIEGLPQALRSLGYSYNNKKYYFAGWQIGNENRYYSNGQVIT
ncbi:MAG: InlB B-repeat-containing protein, partial [Lachnospiraceae bacterium]|nr:InlB B-repeat-containing protein [Lachnospiraceae bacterium]